jgi:hypothetical protein
MMQKCLMAATRNWVGATLSFISLIKLFGSTGLADTAQKYFEARIRAEGIKSRSQQDARVKSLAVAFVEPIHRLIRIAAQAQSVDTRAVPAIELLKGFCIA